MIGGRASYRAPSVSTPLTLAANVHLDGVWAGRDTGGRMRVRVSTTSGYRFIVDDCDNGTFSSNCNQGWTLSVTA
jgi:hypothetical protein